MQRDSQRVPAKSDERRPALLLAAVLAVAFGLRIWMALTLPRYFDDHYVFNNIATYLNGSLRPRHSSYGSLSYLPQAFVLAVCDFLYSWTGMEALAVHGTQFEGFTPGAFLIMRMFVVFYSLLSILMIYLAGRRLFSPTVGLVAAAVLAAYPQHVRSSVQLKPDMMALMFTLITLYWTADAARSPRLSRFLRSGVGVGLAASAKYIGVAAALPLTVWALRAGLRDRRIWARLTLAGVTSVATFLGLNPFLSSVFYYGTRLVVFYGIRAREEQSGHLLVLRSELEFLAFQHGWFLGAFLLLGIALLIRRLGSRLRPENGAAAVLPLSLCLGYPAVHALGMTLFRTHNLLPALGGTALVCAFGIVRCGQWLRERGAAARSPVATLLVWSLPGVFLLGKPFAYTYGRLVPDTWEIAEKALRAELAPLGIRHVAWEPEEVRFGLAQEWQLAAMTAVPSLAALPPSLLDLTDAEVFPRSRARGPRGAFYRDRWRELSRGCALEISAHAFRSQGTPLLLLLHPWTPAGAAIPVGVQRDGGPSGPLVARLPSLLAPGDVLSIELLRPTADESPVGELRLGGRNLPLMYAGRRALKLRFLTPRFRYAAGDTEIQIPASPNAHPINFKMQLWRWTHAACRPRSGSKPR